MMLLGINRLSHTHTLCLPPKTVTHPHLHLSTSFQPSHFIALLCECQLALSALMHSAGIVVKGVCEGWPASSLRGVTRLPPSIATFHLFFSSSSFLTALAAHPCGPGGWSLRSVHGLPCLRWFSLHTFGAGWGGHTLWPPCRHFNYSTLNLFIHQRNQHLYILRYMATQMLIDVQPNSCTNPSELWILLQATNFSPPQISDSSSIFIFFFPANVSDSRRPSLSVYTKRTRE